jgi:hypothetical protein
VEAPFLNALEVSIKDRVRGIFNERVRLHTLRINSPRLQIRLDRLTDSLIVGLHYLSSIIPIDLVSVIILRIVRGCDHDAAGSFLGEDTKGLKHRQEG